MAGAGRWKASKSGTRSVELIELFQDGVSLTFRQLFKLLQDSKEFTTWYTEQLNGSRFSSYFWEHPPLTRATIDLNAEFVLTSAPTLDGLQPDAAPFRSYFGAGEVVTFCNLAGDATLIAPSPVDASADYAHLAAFLHGAPRSQVQAVWQAVGQTVSKSLTDKPIWLSTSGLGVAWLHIRLDSSPKYYQHRPYKVRPAADDSAES